MFHVKRSAPNVRRRTCDGGAMGAGRLNCSLGTILQECGAGLVQVRADGGRLASAAPPLMRSEQVAEPELHRAILFVVARRRPEKRQDVPDLRVSSREFGAGCPCAHRPSARAGRRSGLIRPQAQSSEVPVRSALCSFCGFGPTVAGREL